MPSLRVRFDIRQAGRQVLTAYLALLLLNVAALALLVRPRAHERRSLEESSQPRLDELEAREKAVAGRERFLAALDQVQAALGTLREEVLSTRERRMIEVQLELARLARQFDIDLEEVRYQNEVLGDEALERFAMEVPLEGGYANLRKFIQAVESSDKFLVIERVALATGEDGGVLLRLNITLATYFDAPALRKEPPVRKRAASRRT